MSALPPHPFFGTWRNTDVTSSGVVSLAFEPGMSGTAPRVRAWARASGAGQALIALEQAAEPIELFGGIGQATTPLAFTARLGSDDADHVLLQGNINRGLMILAAYRCTASQPPLAGRFSREFYARRDDGIVKPPTTVPGRLFDAHPATRAPSTDDFVGRWINCEPTSPLPTLEIISDGPRLRVGTEGEHENTPGRSFAYFDEVGHDTMLLLARLEHEHGRSDLQIKVINGLAVVAAFHSRTDDGSWFTREFLRRAP